jgi:hypothetical protein
MPKRKAPAGKSPKVTTMKERKSPEEEFELLLRRTAAKLKAKMPRTPKKESAA